MLDTDQLNTLHRQLILVDEHRSADAALIGDTYRLIVQIHHCEIPHTSEPDTPQIEQLIPTLRYLIALEHNHRTGHPRPDIPLTLTGVHRHRLGRWAQTAAAMLLGEYATGRSKYP